ncbi:LexA signal peptidase [Pisolithus croceorrhizus]|nr:LexA signal peptidase [Pisolithus croceorrhizus]KAI6130544.1 LexA signal peptidase [Pisolithus croceorrhizus]KAI6164751.1 LexA signal peptidase [Pisolithus thermaeus]
MLYWAPLVVGFNQYFYTVKTIRGRSMQPTFNPDTSAWNDVVVFDRHSINSGKPILRGDIVSLRDPIRRNRTIVKRVLAVPGDVIKTLPPYPQTEVLIPEGHIWVEGDEPFHSLDSNSFGPIPLALVDARLHCIIWPLCRLGPLRRPTSSSTAFTDSLKPLRNSKSPNTAREQSRVTEAASISFHNHRVTRSPESQ